MPEQRKGWEGTMVTKSIALSFLSETPAVPPRRPIPNPRAASTAEPTPAWLAEQDWVIARLQELLAEERAKHNSRGTSSGSPPEPWPKR
jgi:hypothetical protein